MTKTIGDYREAVRAEWERLSRHLPQADRECSAVNVWRLIAQWWAEAALETWRAGSATVPDGGQLLCNALLLEEMWADVAPRVRTPWPQKPGVYGGRAGKSAMAVAVAFGSEVHAAIRHNGFPFAEESDLPESVLTTWTAEALTRLAQICPVDVGGLTEELKAEVLRQNREEPAAATTTNRVEWNDADPDYMPKREAVEWAVKAGRDHDVEELRAMDYGRLRNLLTRKQCEIRYMVTPSKPPRGKVHRADWESYIRRVVREHEQIEDIVEKRVRSLA